MLVTKLKKYVEDKGIKVVWLSKKTGVNWTDRFLGRVKTKTEELEKACKALNIKVRDLEEN